MDGHAAAQLARCDRTGGDEVIDWSPGYQARGDTATTFASAIGMPDPAACFDFDLTNAWLRIEAGDDASGELARVA